jgi:phage gp46-like protein
MCILPLLIGCGAGTGPTYPPGNNNRNSYDGNQARQSDGQAEVPQQPATGLLQPSDLTYIGAFRLPDASEWEWSGEALAFRPDGDTDGADDGFPGSLYAVGHDWDMQVGEITIPEPVAPGDNGLDGLNRAETLQALTDVRSGVAPLDRLTEMVRAGMAHLPAQGRQTGPKLYLCFGEHMEDGDEDALSLMWCEPDLTGAQGAWRVDAESPYAVNDYMFEIPLAWAATNTPGKLLATGRFRDGGWSGQGPSLFAIGPWNAGNPPADGAVLDATPLLRYDSTEGDEEPFATMDDYHHSDEWSGGAWLTADTRAAVVFVGTKGIGECWYGLPDGTVWPDEPPYPSDPAGDRGWWSDSFEGQMLFYDPSDLAAVARGEMQPNEPQPYATRALDDALLHTSGGQQKQHVRACAFDAERGVLYVVEPLADGDRSIVHAWRVG